MKKPPIIKILAFGLFISVTLLPAGSLRAAERPKGSSNLESQASKTGNKLGYNQAKDWGQEPERKENAVCIAGMADPGKIDATVSKDGFSRQPRRGRLVNDY